MLYLLHTPCIVQRRKECIMPTGANDPYQYGSSADYAIDDRMMDEAVKNMPRKAKFIYTVSLVALIPVLLVGAALLGVKEVFLKTFFPKYYAEYYQPQRY